MGLAAALMAASTIILAGPAGAVVNNQCQESNNPGLQGGFSGLTVACTFTNSIPPQPPAGLTGVTGFFIKDYPNAEWQYGAVRNVVITRAASNNTFFTNTAAGANNAGNLPIGTADINHSVEGPGVTPGSVVLCIATGCSPALAAGQVKLNRPLVASAAGNFTVKVANVTNRAVTDGTTANGTGVITSATAHFCAAASATCSNSDIGMRVSGGDLPDGATIGSVQSTIQATAVCGTVAVPCQVSPFSGTHAASNVVITLQRNNAATSYRWVTGATFSGHTITSNNTSSNARFASTDVGLVVGGNAGIPAGARIVSSVSNGTTTVATVGGLANLTGTGPQSFFIGQPAANAPANNDIIAQLAIALIVNPALSPTSPACAANKVSGFQIEMQWKNPGSYDLHVVDSTHFSGGQVPGVSTAQIEFPSSATTFAGFLVQNVTTTGTSAAPVTNPPPTTTGWTVKHTLLPIGVGLCPGSTLMGTWNFNSISLQQAMAPTNTGPPGAGLRTLKPVPQGKTQAYGSAAYHAWSASDTGATLAAVNASGQNTAIQPQQSNLCTVASPNVVHIGC